MFFFKIVQRSQLGFGSRGSSKGGFNQQKVITVPDFEWKNSKLSLAAAQNECHEGIIIIRFL